MSCSNHRITQPRSTERYELHDSPTGLELVVRPMRASRLRAARTRARGLAAALLVWSALFTAGCAALASRAPAPSTTTYSYDCRLGPSDCGYGDNGHNGDH